MSKIASLLIASALVSSVIGTANAAPGEPVTRAQVLAELQAARASGDLQRAQGENGDYSTIELGQGSSTLTRVQVRQDVAKVKAAGRLNEAFRESPVEPVASVPKSLSRQEVRAELDRARRSGELERLNSNDSHDRDGRL
jgi:hypothetical protein